jgi:branched-chain amino acid aminotransferase
MAFVMPPDSPPLWSYLNGDFLPEAQISISVQDRSFQYADGIFDTLRVEHGRAIDSEKHLERLQRHGALICLHFNWDQIKYALQTLIEKNKNNFPNQSVLKIHVSRLGQRRGLGFSVDGPLTLLIRQSPFPKFDADKVINCVISNKVKRYSGSILSRIKSLSYVENILALHEAKSMGADEALILNEKNHLTCASSSNIFIKTDEGHWLTPLLTDGVLDGIEREKFIHRLGAEETSIDLDQLRTAQDIGLTNSVYGWRRAKLGF